MLFFFVLAFGAQAQNLTHRFKYRHRISQKDLLKLNGQGYFIEDTVKMGPHLHYQICSTRKPLEIIIEQKGDVLKLNPWPILDHRVDTTLDKKYVDPCYQQTGVINADTDNFLIINMTKRTKIGYPVERLKLKYRTWVVGITSVGLKVRPKVKDASDKEHAVNFISGNINVGVTAGYSYGKTTFTQLGSNNWSVTPALALGFSSIKLKDEVLKKKDVDLSRNLNTLVLGPAATVTVARNDIGLILSYGHDFAIGRNQSAWAYHGKPFYALGISLGLKL